MTVQIKKRDGSIVAFDKEKIAIAISRAFEAHTIVSEIVIDKIVDDVVEQIDISFKDALPSVEDVQDAVERQINNAGYFDVAKSYILYRYEHKKIRDEEKFEDISKHKLKVTKRDGSTVPFDLGKIKAHIKLFTGDAIDASEMKQMLEEIKNGIFDKISTKEITRILIMSMNARIEKDPMFSYFSARFLLNDLYKDILGVNEFDKNFVKMYRESLKNQLAKEADIERLDMKLMDFDFEKLSEAIEPSRDHMFNYMGIETLYERYFARDYEQNILELPQHFFMRVCMGLAMDEKESTKYAIEFYALTSQHLYTPSTPTLFHAGTTHPQMSSCYLTTVEDDLGHIFKCIADNAQLSKWSGGIGNDWTNIRGTGALIKSTNVGSQGVIPFLKIDDATTAAINRSGKRRGAACIYLETWHYDIESFIELRKNTGDERRRIHDTDTANWIPDLFMKRVLEDGPWTLFSTDEAPDLHHTYGKEFEKRYIAYEEKAKNGEMKMFKTIRAAELWRKIISMLFETGHPWITFKDPCNVRSPQDHVGIVHSSNLCTEITLNTSRDETAVCNLGSINVVNHITKTGKLDKKKMEHTVRLAMRMLDNVIDSNFYPTIEAKNSNLKHRPVGLGIMGLQDAFYKMKLDFDSEEAVEASDEIMEFIAYQAILSSSELAKEKGVYDSYLGSKWDRNIFPIDTIVMLEKERGLSTNVDRRSKLDWKIVRDHVRKYGMRNSNCMAIAPTATISTIVGSYPSVEPIYENLYVKSNQTGEFTVINEYLVTDLKELGLWDDEMVRKLKYFDGSVQQILEIPADVRARYKEAFEIDPSWVIKHAAYRGKWIDQSQSINIFTPTKSGKELSNIYISAWKMGLKTTYYLRSRGASTIEKSTLDLNKKYESPVENIQTESIVVPIIESIPVMEVIKDAVFSGENDDLSSIPQCKIDDPDCEACQ